VFAVEMEMVGPKIGDLEVEDLEVGGKGVAEVTDVTRDGLTKDIFGTLIQDNVVMMWSKFFFVPSAWS
jgi:hypothetical protein